MLKKAFEEIQNALLDAVRRHYGEGLVSLVVYGSAGRGTQRFDSDLDFLVVADGLPAGRMRRVTEFKRIEDDLQPLLSRLEERGFRVALSPVFKTREEALQGSPLFLDMLEDALILVDKEGFFARVLERMGQRLSALGARRIWRGSSWHWDLKPDFRPGEVFEL